MTSEPRVLIADDQELIRAGLRLLLQAARTSTSSGRPVSGREAVAMGRAVAGRMW